MHLPHRTEHKLAGRAGRARLRNEVLQQPAVAATQVDERARAGAAQRGRHKRMALHRDGRLEHAPVAAAGKRGEAPAQQPHRQLRVCPCRGRPQALRAPSP